jgi:predicted transcriptional regulator
MCEVNLMLKRIFIHEKTVEIVLKVLEAEEKGKVVYPMVIAKEIDSPYSYVSKILNELEKFAVIESELRGRTRVLRFTEDGRKLAKVLRELVKELEKDFVARKRLSKLREVIDSSENGDFKRLAGVIAELERLKDSRDREVVEGVKELKKRIEDLLQKAWR